MRSSLLRILKKEARTISRDGFLIFILILPLIIALLFRYLLPFANTLTLKYLEFSIEPYYDFGLNFIIIMPALMYGWIIGFILLDDKDENILEYISVTPLQKSGYLLYKILIPYLASLPISYLSAIVYGLSEFSPLKLILLILIIGLEAPFMALFLSVFARNKVEGLAVAKLANLIIIGPIVAYFIPSEFHYIGGILPTFWVTKAWLSSGTIFWIFLGIGFIVHLAYVMGMLILFNRKFR